MQKIKKKISPLWNNESKVKNVAETQKETSKYREGDKDETMSREILPTPLQDQKSNSQIKYSAKFHLSI